MNLPLPRFEPLPLLGNPHLQTILGSYLKGKPLAGVAQLHRVALADEDAIALHENRPADWNPGDPVVILLHGLAGSYRSSYMQRIAAKLVRRGTCAFRMDLRGSGAGIGWARLPYHSGLTADVQAVVSEVSGWAPGSPIYLVGFSLSGNVVLKLLGELGEKQLVGLAGAVAVSPPVDLEACSQLLALRENRRYNRHFVSVLMRHLKTRRRLRPDAVDVDWSRWPESLREFDDRFTSRVSGFRDVEDYYERSSSLPLLGAIRLPTLILVSADDPFISTTGLKAAQLPKNVSRVITEQGGHLGFLGRRGTDADCRWMDWRILDWLAAQQLASASTLRH